MTNFGPMMPDMGGMQINGKWFNPRTGESVIVRDSYLDGDTMMLRLSNGRLVSLMDFQDFVQMSDDIYNEKGEKIGKADDSKKPATNKKPDVDESLLFDGMEPLGPVEETPEQIDDALSSILEQEGLVPSTKINDKIKKIDPQPLEDAVRKELNEQISNTSVDMVLQVLDAAKTEMNFKVDFTTYPDSDIDVLKRVFRVTDEDIVNALIKKFVNFDEIKEQVTKWVESHYNIKLTK